jgi:hypothetical protein
MVDVKRRRVLYPSLGGEPLLSRIVQDVTRDMRGLLTLPMTMKNPETAARIDEVESQLNRLHDRISSGNDTSLM